MELVGLLNNEVRLDYMESRKNLVSQVTEISATGLFSLNMSGNQTGSGHCFETCGGKFGNGIKYGGDVQWYNREIQLWGHRAGKEDEKQKNSRIASGL